MEKILKQALNKNQNKILCVGKNYFDHIKEMGGDKKLDQPIIFQKPLSSIFLTENNKNWPLPQFNNEIHHEIELAFIISKSGKNIQPQNYLQYIGGYFLAIDFTDRDLQGFAKKKGFPWDLAKGQDNFCVLSQFIDKDMIQDPHNIRLRLKINDKVVQESNTELMIHNIPKVLSYISQYMTLNQGDIILMGTPSGVGPIKENDKLEAQMLQNEKIVTEFYLNVIKPKL